MDYMFALLTGLPPLLMFAGINSFVKRYASHLNHPSATLYALDQAHIGAIPFYALNSDGNIEFAQTVNFQAFCESTCGYSNSLNRQNFALIRIETFTGG